MARYLMFSTMASLSPLSLHQLYFDSTLGHTVHHPRGYSRLFLDDGMHNNSLDLVAMRSVAQMIRLASGVVLTANCSSVFVELDYKYAKMRYAAFLRCSVRAMKWRPIDAGCGSTGCNKDPDLSTVHSIS